MKKIYKGVILAAFAGITAIGFVSCDKANDWPVEEGDNRLFRPTEVTSTISSGVLSLSWKSKPSANAYKIELSKDSLLFAQILSSITVKPQKPDGSPLVMGDILQSSARYSVRIKSLDTTNTKAESEWNAITFTVPAEGILSTVASADITTTGAKLKWVQNNFVTHIMIGTNRYNIAPTELAVGEKSITGLTTKTAYTAQIYYNDMLRGQIAFTTK